MAASERDKAVGTIVVATILAVGRIAYALAKTAFKILESFAS